MPLPLPGPAPCAGALLDGDGEGLPTVPDAGGVDGVGEADGELGGTVDELGVGVGLVVGVGVGARVDELALGRVEPEVDPVAGARDVVGVALPE